MELEFDRSAEDVIAFNMYHMAHSASARREAMSTRVLISVIVAWFAGGYNILDPRYLNWIVLGAALTAALAVFFAYPPLARRSTLDRMRKLLKEGNNETMFGPQRVAISPERILASNKTTESKIAWAAVQQIAEGEKHLFLFTSAMNAIVIPKTAFKSDEVKQEFVRLVEAYRKAGR
jgi:hypothetical protein